VVVQDVFPLVDAGRFPLKRVAGEWLEVWVDVFADGHDQLTAKLQHRRLGATTWEEQELASLGDDRWHTGLRLSEIGTVEYRVIGWVDQFGTWQRDLYRRDLRSPEELRVELEAGAQLVDAAAASAKGAPAKKVLRTIAQNLRGGDLDLARHEALKPEVAQVVHASAPRPQAATSPTYEVMVERERARFSTWYERFPRSTSREPGVHGTLRDLEAELPRIAEMGFDVLYLPPVHPIGVSHRKGPNNTPNAGPDDIGSPWAIGAKEGGHTAIHPQLGTLADFDHLYTAAAEHGLEIAMDLAFQCSPDHPWVEEHPTWFKHRPDGSVRYAENPPKRYQDIYPLDFESEDWREMWLGLKGVVDFWTARGVRIFRVDNPHTKAFGFWEWLIREVRRECPDTIFLSEAFTRPRVMERLAKLGFTQSYTYFTWRTDKAELTKYIDEVCLSRRAQYMRPNFWPNTPDILPYHLQSGQRGTFVARLVMAATAAANYGIYGPAFELLEHTALYEGAEEYVDSEKFQLRQRDLAHPDRIDHVIAKVNAARREHRALQRNDTMLLLESTNDKVLAYAKAMPDGSDSVVVAVNLDPHFRQMSTIRLPLAKLGLDPWQDYDAVDLISGTVYRWNGESAYVELDPRLVPAHILYLRQPCQAPPPEASHSAAADSQEGSSN
jgi:starch synthase (maltosyl-transferring)